ncbi:MAG: hemolysin family protein [bacterium]
MDTQLTLEILAILVLIAANGFFSLSEFSIIASSGSRLKHLKKTGRRGTRSALRLKESPERFLATVQVGITLVGTTAGVFGGATLVEPLRRLLVECPWPYLAGVAGPVAVGTVTVLITITAVVLGELVPKYLALSNPERYARVVARPIFAFTRLTSVFSHLLSVTASLIVRLLGVGPTTGREEVGEEEINLMIFEGKQKGVFDETEERLVKSVFDFADSTARRAMTPRPDVIGVELSTNAAEIINLFVNHGHSRYPVYEKSIDHVVGVLYAKDLMLNRLDPQLIVLKDLIRKPIFVPDSMPLPRLLLDFQRRRQRMAVVLDEFGGTAGIITLHDILEELVGEMMEEGESGSPELVKHSEAIAFADGLVWPGDVNELLDCHLPEDKIETLAGLLMDELGRLPEKSETIQIADTRITVLETEGNRLTRLKLERLEKES